MTNITNNNIFLSNFYNKLIEDLKDEALAWRISFELGGLRYYVAQKIKEDHIFSNYGTNFCEWISYNYGGEYIIFPSGANNINKRNNLQAEILVQKGFSNNEIARKLGIHYSSARRARKRVEDKNKNH